MSARAIAHALFRHRSKAMAALLLSLGLGAAFIQAHPQMWRAEATLLVEGDGKQAAATLAALAQSRDLHRPVIDQMGPRLYPRLPAPERADAFARALSVRSTENGLVHLALDGSEGALTAEALSALVAALPRPSPQTGGGDPAAAKAVLLKRRDQLETDVAAAEAETSVLSEQAAALKARLADIPATIEIANHSEGSRVAEDARAKLFELHAKEAELLGKYQETSIFVQNNRAEMVKVEQMLARLEHATQSKVTSGANPVRQDVEKDAFRAEAALSSARARAKAASRQLAETEAKLRKAAARAETERPGGGTGFGVVQTASPSARPLGPSPVRILAVAAGLGMLLALAVAGLAQRLSSRLSTPADIERRLGLPVLTSIPRES